MFFVSQCPFLDWYAYAIPLCQALAVSMIITGGDGPKMIDLLQMREKHLLQDRIELLGPVRHSDVRDVSL